MTEQTAVEWLVDKVTDMIHESNHLKLVSLLEQAKQMEKEQIKLIWYYGRHDINFPANGEILKFKK